MLESEVSHYQQSTYFMKHLLWAKYHLGRTGAMQMFGTKLAPVWVPLVQRSCPQAQLEA